MKSFEFVTEWACNCKMGLDGAIFLDGLVNKLLTFNLLSLSHSSFCL